MKSLGQSLSKLSPSLIINMNRTLPDAISLVLLCKPFHFGKFNIPVTHPPTQTPEYIESLKAAAIQKRLRKAIAKAK